MNSKSNKGSQVHPCVHVAAVVGPCCVSKELAGSEQSETSCQETLLLIAQSGRRREAMTLRFTQRCIKAQQKSSDGFRTLLKVRAGRWVSVPETGGVAAGSSC